MSGAVLISLPTYVKTFSEPHAHPYIHSVYINIVPHKALTSVLISKSLAELAAEDSKLDGALLSKEHTLYLSFLGPNKPTLIFT